MGKRKNQSLSSLIAWILSLLFLLLDISPDVKLIGVIVIYSALFLVVGMMEKLEDEL
jgi:hypothetical protein